MYKDYQIIMVLFLCIARHDDLQDTISFVYHDTEIDILSRTLGKRRGKKNEMGYNETNQVQDNIR